MNDGAYASLPSIQGYLDRIGIACPEEPSPAFLDRLVYAHQRRVPFENLDVYDKHAEPSLAVSDLYDKVVVRRRGGYCFELNGLFAALLRDLGFETWPCSARVLLRPDAHPAITHRCNAVRFADGVYLVDVGFGGPEPGFAPKVEDGFSRTGFCQTFSVRHAREGWWDVLYQGGSGEGRAVLSVCTMPSEEADFAALSFFQSQCPTSSFRMRRIVNIRTEGGARTLENMTLTEHVNGASTATELAGDQELDQVLSLKFGIEDWR